MNTKALTITSNLPSINIRFFDRFKKSYKAFEDESSFKYEFSQRNNLDSITPFLDCLNTTYKIITQELILVEETNEVRIKLNDLGFLPTDSICPKTVFFNKLLSFTKGLFNARLYHVNYKFDIYLVNKSQWDNIDLAKEIVDDLKIKDKDYFSIYIKVLKRIDSFRPF